MLFWCASIMLLIVICQFAFLLLFKLFFIKRCVWQSETYICNKLPLSFFLPAEVFVSRIIRG
jgi:hypothetical protein